MENSLKQFQEKRKKAYDSIPRSIEIIKGSLVIVARVCGKANCRCVKGHKHKSLYLSQSRGGKTIMTYIPKRAEKKVSAAVMRHKEMLVGINKISELNIKLLTKRYGYGKKQSKNSSS